jgi:hypothetical protein
MTTDTSTPYHTPIFAQWECLDPENDDIRNTQKYPTTLRYGIFAPVHYMELPTMESLIFTEFADSMLATMRTPSLIMEY